MVVDLDQRVAVTVEMRSMSSGDRKDGCCAPACENGIHLVMRSLALHGGRRLLDAYPPGWLEMVDATVVSAKRKALVAAFRDDGGLVLEFSLS